MELGQVVWNWDTVYSRYMRHMVWNGDTWYIDIGLIPGSSFVLAAHDYDILHYK